MLVEDVLKQMLRPSMVSIAVAIGFLAAGVWVYERTASSPVSIAVVASLAALASTGRIAFASIPNVQPTTFIVATTGIVLGPAQGYMVGVLSALASNTFLGHGPWTPWQMAAWGAAGASAGALGAVVPRADRRHLAVFLGLWGFLFGLIMNVWYWLSFTFPLSLKTLMVVLAAGLWFDAMHAAGNVLFALLFGDRMLKTLRRFARRLTHVAPAVLLVVVLTLASTAGPVQAGAPAVADVERAIARGIAYLRSCQNPDGGFAAAPGGVSSEMVTSWAVMAIRSAGLDPTSAVWKKGARSPASFLLSADGFLDTTASSTDIARRVLALRALGADAYQWAISPLAGALGSRQKADGRFEGEGEDGLLNVQFWSVIGLSSEGEAFGDPGSALEFLLANANSDGGFGYASGLPSDPDDTAAAIQAMIALGETGEPLERAVRYLSGTVSGEGGVAWEGSRPNVASASWALQALNAARNRLPESAVACRARVLSWMMGLQAPDGSFAYMKDEVSMPAWMTANAILGLSGLSFPLAVGFSDVPPAHWAASQINRLARLGSLTGYPGGVFKPEKSVTRGEFAVMLARTVEACDAQAQGDDAFPDPGFRDVPRTHWAWGAVARAYGLGLVRGLEPKVFGPDDPVTGAQVAVVACRLAGLTELQAVSGEPWYEPFTSAASRLGLLYPGFNALELVSRAGCAYVLAEACTAVDVMPVAVYPSQTCRAYRHDIWEVSCPESASHWKCRAPGPQQEPDTLTLAGFRRKMRSGDIDISWSLLTASTTDRRASNFRSHRQLRGRLPGACDAISS